jgi:hypothetical protein
MEKPYKFNHYKARKTPLVEYLDYILLISKIYETLFHYFIKLTNEDTKLVEKIDKEFLKEFEVDIYLKKNIKKTLALKKIRTNLYKKFFKKTTPKLIVLPVYYNNYYAIIAAKELNIPVVELQHGIITNSHLAYNYPPLKRKSNVVPDYILTFGDYWRKKISLPIESKNIRSIGFKFFNMQYKKYSNYKRKKIITFISQASIGNKLSKIASDLEKKINNEFKIIYKLHPGETRNWKKKYPWLIKNKIKVIHNEIPLYKILAESNILIGVCSTVIYEAIGMKIPKIILLNLPGVEELHDLINQSYAHKANNICEILKIIEQNKTVKRKDINKFFLRNSSNNFKLFLRAEFNL